MEPRVRRVRLFELDFAALAQPAAAEHIRQLVRERRHLFVLPVNVDVLVRLHRSPADPAFREACSSADVVFADGMPIVWASRILGTPLPGRVTGIDLLLHLCDTSDLSAFFLGARPGIAARAAGTIRQRNPGFSLAGLFSPPIGFERDATLVKEAIDAVNRARPDLLFVALGPPRAEKWIHRYLPNLDVGAAMPVGGAFDMLAGVVPRAPSRMRHLGLEWLWRLAWEPKRLWRRYLVENLQFFNLLYREWKLRTARPRLPNDTLL